MHFTFVALWLRPGAAIDLDAITAALAHHHFFLFVGRKAGPLGSPRDRA